ncbi:MAG: type II toxin-antitoxin system HicA family toxin [Dehalococcoidia bacterium]
MPARARELIAVAERLGFRIRDQKGSHVTMTHPDGRVTTVPFHGSREIGGPLYYAILKQLGISEEEFRRLK